MVGSVAAQTDYFEKLIIKKPSWSLVDIYADESIAGISMHHRDAFKCMIADALAGKMDLVITKSLFRLVRNTVDKNRFSTRAEGVPASAGVPSNLLVF